MAVYVDAAKHPYRGALWCHLLADTVEELHTFARRLGLKPHWFQDHRQSRPHYDLAPSLRAKAVALGAREITDEEVVELLRRYRKEHLDAAGQTG